ncbi:MAG: hypothetical protein R3343_00920 [Nitriliruptorales bacterium]|nr:hypothetical protein [Nitriliruptorales bacterium]
MPTGRQMNVTPAGNNLYQVEIEVDGGDDTQDSIVEVAIPDGFLDDLALDGDASPQDVVLEAVRFVLDRTEQPDELAPRLSLDDLAERHPGFTERLDRRFADDPETGTGSTHAQHTAEREREDADDQLVAEVREEQAEGQASQQTERF